MRIDGENIYFEYLRAVDISDEVGTDSPIKAKASAPFNSPNAPGEPKDAGDVKCIEQMGRNAVVNFNTVFA